MVIWECGWVFGVLLDVGEGSCQTVVGRAAQRYNLTFCLLRIVFRSVVAKRDAFSFGRRFFRWLCRVQIRELAALRGCLFVFLTRGVDKECSLNE